MEDSFSEKLPSHFIFRDFGKILAFDENIPDEELLDRPFKWKVMVAALIVFSYYCALISSFLILGHNTIEKDKLFLAEFSLWVQM